MLTDLSWLRPGASFPPKCEQDRLNRYRENERLFLSQHDEVWREKFKQLAMKYKKKNFDVETIINYQQLLSKKTADFVCGTAPRIETEGETDDLVKMLERHLFSAKLYEAFLDVSRYGNGILKLIGKGLSAVSPQCWFPIVDPSDVKNITHHVIAYLISPDNQGNMTELFVEIHTAGRIEQKRYGFNAKDGTIEALKEQYSKTYATGFDVPAVIVLSNLTHSGSIYGVDDYGIINSIISRIMWRLHCAGTILDKHSEPSMSGPESALQYDERTGMWYLPLANYFKRSANEDPDVRYITWEGNLDANFKEIEQLFNQLYILTEMGQAFLEGGGGGEAASGTALRLRMVSPRIKAKRLVGINAGTVKKMITLLAQVNGITVDYDTLTLHWEDGLPEDEKEQYETLVAATGGKAVMSQYSALKRRGLSDVETEKELEQIRLENAANGPVVLGVVDRLAEE